MYFNSYTHHTSVYFVFAQYKTLFTHATSRSDKNSFKHVRETKSIKKKRNNLKITHIT